MTDCTPSLSDLIERVRQLELENAELRSRLSQQQQQPVAASGSNSSENGGAAVSAAAAGEDWFMYAKQQQQQQLRHHLTQEQIARYSRHLLLPEIGTAGQDRLCKGSVLIVGLGGLGSPCALYLAAAGVGRLGFVDFDKVDTSNLHRQVIHRERSQGMDKVESARNSILELNSSVRVDLHREGFTERNGLELVKQYDVIIDGSDNVSTRYLINDACVMAGKPLVSGSAVRFEGQLTIYNYQNHHHHNDEKDEKEGEERGPCYRCMFPTPPPAETVTNCADGGVLGVVPGIIGCLQALEAQKLLMKMGEEQLLVKRMLIFNAKTCNFRTVKIRSRRRDCAVCGDSPSIASLVAYQQHCSDAPAPAKPLQDQLLLPEQRITCEEYRQILREKRPHVLVDVRDAHQFDIASLPGAINVPLKQLQTGTEECVERIRQEIHRRRSSESSNGNENGNGEGEECAVFVVCRRGIASVRGTKLLLEHGISAKNINGGVTQWQRTIDVDFPTY